MQKVSGDLLTLSGAMHAMGLALHAAMVLLQLPPGAPAAKLQFLVPLADAHFQLLRRLLQVCVWLGGLGWETKI